MVIFVFSEQKYSHFIPSVETGVDLHTRSYASGSDSYSSRDDACSRVPIIFPLDKVCTLLSFYRAGCRDCEKIPCVHFRCLMGLHLSEAQELLHPLCRDSATEMVASERQQIYCEFELPFEFKSNHLHTVFQCKLYPVR